MWRNITNVVDKKHFSGCILFERQKLTVQIKIKQERKNAPATKPNSQ